LIRLIDRYIGSEILVYYFAIYIAMVILFTANDLFLMLGQFVRSKVPWEVMFQMTYLRSFFFMPLLVPAAVLFSVLLGVGRMAYDNEINALRTSGVPVRRLLRMPFIIGLVSSFLVWHLDRNVTPPNLKKWSDLWYQYIAASVGMEAIRPERFLRGPENQYFYFASVDTKNQTFTSAVALKTQFGTQVSEIYTAQSGTYKDNILYLQNGQHYKFDFRGQITETAQFDLLEIDVKTVIGDKIVLALPPQYLSLPEIQAQMAALRNSGTSAYPAAELYTEHYFRFSFPLTPLLFALITFSLATRATRGGRYTSIVYAIFLFSVYYGLVSGARILGYISILPPVLAGWAVIIVFGALGLILLIRGER
jgi:lipopolysaccharide export LptBFGC system permease protein LptF